MNDQNNENIAQMMDAHTPEIQALVAALRDLIRSTAPDLKEEVKMAWGNIVYKQNTLVVAISPYSNHVNLNFYKGIKLSDPARVLEGTGRELRHVKINPTENLRTEVLVPMIQQACHLDAG
jgi:hypothetical protein